VQDVVVPASFVQKLEEEVTSHQLVVWVCKWLLYLKLDAGKGWNRSPGEKEVLNTGKDAN